MALRWLSRRAPVRQADRRARRPGLEGLESRQLLAVSIAEFPTQLVGAQPTSITSAPDGNLWFTLAQLNAIGSINPTTHAFQFFPGIGGQSITAGPDGNLWLAGGGSIGSFNPTTHVISQFAIPSGGQALSITAGPDGNLWFTEFPTRAPFDKTLGQINPTTHAIAEFSVPVSQNGSDITSNITSGPDGNLWMTSSFTDTIVSFSPATHAVAEFAVPNHFFGASGALPHNGLNGITTGPDGNLWFTETLVNRVGRINPTTHALDEFFLPSPNSYPTGITAGPNGSVWFTEAARQNANLDNPFQFIPVGASAVASIDTATGAISTYRTPSVNTNPLGITLGPDGHLWFAEQAADQIGEAIPHPDDGPQITSVVRTGVHAQPTTLVLTFNQSLDPASAQNLANYRLVGPNRQPVAIASAVYNPTANTVTLAPASRLNVHWNYALTVVGTAPHGVTDIYGGLLDGAGTGQPGSDYQATITWRNLVISRVVPKVTKFTYRSTAAVHATPKHAVTVRHHR